MIGREPKIMKTENRTWCIVAPSYCAQSSFRQKGPEPRSRWWSLSNAASLVIVWRHLINFLRDGLVAMSVFRFHATETSTPVSRKSRSRGSKSPPSFAFRWVTSGVTYNCKSCRMLMFYSGATLELCTLADNSIYNIDKGILVILNCRETVDGLRETVLYQCRVTSLWWINWLEMLEHIKETKNLFLIIQKDVTEKA